MSRNRIQPLRRLGDELIDWDFPSHSQFSPQLLNVWARPGRTATLHVNPACRHLKGREQLIGASISELTRRLCSSCAAAPAPEHAKAVATAIAVGVAADLSSVGYQLARGVAAAATLSEAIDRAASGIERAQRAGLADADAGRLIAAVEQLRESVARLGDDVPAAWWEEAAISWRQVEVSRTGSSRSGASAGAGITFQDVRQARASWEAAMRRDGRSDLAAARKAAFAPVVQGLDSAHPTLDLLPDRPRFDPAGYPTLRAWMRAEWEVAVRCSMEELVDDWEATYYELRAMTAVVELLGIHGQPGGGLGEAVTVHFEGRRTPGGMVVREMPEGLAAWLVDSHPESFALTGPPGACSDQLAEIVAGLHPDDGTALAETLATARLV